MNFSIEKRLVGTIELSLIINPFKNVLRFTGARNYSFINFMRNCRLYGRYFGLIQIDFSVTPVKNNEWGCAYQA